MTATLHPMRIPLLLLLVLCSFALQAQISQGGEPLHWSSEYTSRVDVPTVVLAEVDTEALLEEDAREADKARPFRFGLTQTVDIDFMANAIVERTDSYSIHRLAIQSPGAVSLNFLLSEYDLPVGGRLFLYNESKTAFLGAFTSANMKEGGHLAIGLISGEKVIFEYHHPIGAGQKASFTIKDATHGYRSILGKGLHRGPFGNSGSCNINVACPEAAPYVNQMRSVVLIVSGGALCSGSMIANTTLDDTPYLLTANHCFEGSSNGDPTTWTYYFQHQSTSCNGSNGPTTLSVSSADLLTRDPSSDVALIQLSSVPPDDFDVYYAGWNSSTSFNITSSTYAIHHPSGDVKKICFDEDAPTFATSGSAQLWRVNQWESGTTEGGSSGCPLFDDNNLIIGQLFGGLAACSGGEPNGDFDVFGRFGVSYPLLEEWLNPIDSGLTSLSGYYPNGMSDSIPNPPPPEPMDSVAYSAYVFPTVSSGEFRVFGNEVKDISVSVYDVLGNNVLNQDYFGNDNYLISLSGIFQKGMYIVVIDTDEGQFTYRVVYDQEE